MKTKLLIVHYSLYNGGAERSLVNFLTLLPPDRYAIDLMLFRREGLFYAQLPKHVRVIEAPPLLPDLFYNPNSMDARSGGLRGLRARAVRTLGTGTAALLAHGKNNASKQLRWKYFYRHAIQPLPGAYDVAMAFMHNEPTYFVCDKVSAKRKLAWVHNDYSRTGLKPELDEPYYARMDGVATISDGCLRVLQSTFPDLQSKFRCLPNLTSAQTVRTLAQAFAPEEFDPSVPALLSVGRLNAQKAYDLSIAAAALLKKRGVPFRWYVIGSGEKYDELKAQIAQADVGDRLLLLGARENPYPYMARCDVLVQNSRYEGKSVVLDEAKILGRPILATRYPTVGDQLTDGETGVLADVNAEAIAEGIERLLRDEALRARLSANLSALELDNTEQIARYMEWISG